MKLNYYKVEAQLYELLFVPFNAPVNNNIIAREIEDRNWVLGEIVSKITIIIAHIGQCAVIQRRIVTQRDIIIQKTLCKYKPITVNGYFGFSCCWF